MTKEAKNRGKYAGQAASLLAAASLACSPLLFPALAASLTGKKIESASLLDSFTPAGVDSKLAAKFNLGLGKSEKAVKTSESRFAFTPAGIGNKNGRTITIAARTDSPLSSKAISTRSALKQLDVGQRTPARLAKSDFRLTASRGWKGFTAPVVENAAVRAPLSNLKLGKSSFRLDGKANAKAGARKSRFQADMRVDQTRSAAPSPSGNAAAGEYKVDLEGSFSVSKRVAVTAGVRYQSERDRVNPDVTDRKDSEAVYVGTKIRF